MAITAVMTYKNHNPEITNAEALRRMVLSAAPHCQFPLQPFTDEEVYAAAHSVDATNSLVLLNEFTRILVSGRQPVLDMRTVKLNALVAEIDAMAASGRQVEPIVAAQIMLDALERLEEISGNH